MFYTGVIVMGLICLLRLPIELMPNYSFGDISIYVDIRGGMPPIEVENLVSRPIEDAVGTVSHLRDLISISEEGRSRVVLTFEPGTDMDFASLETREKFARVKNKLPPEIEKPVIAKFEQSDLPVLNLAVTGKGYTTEMLRRLVDEEIKDRLLRINGVANIDVGGGRERKILVEIDQTKLQAFGLPIGKVINQMSLNNLNLLIGDIEKRNDKYVVRTIGEFKNIDQIKSIGVAVAPSGALIRLKDVAEVKDSYLEATSFSRVDALPVVSLYIQKESMANTVKVANDVLKEVDAIMAETKEKIRIIPTYNQAEYIKRAINGVKQSLIYGGILAIAVLFLFLWEIKSTFIIGIAIPISVIATFNLMFFQKITLNVMTLSGLALGSGMLVDNSIVVLENIFKMRERGVKKILAAAFGSEEMYIAIVASTLTNVVVFLPIVFVNKEIRILYSGLAFTITYSLLISLVVALTLVPMLSARLPSKKWDKAETALPKKEIQTIDDVLKEEEAIPVRTLRHPGLFYRWYRRFLSTCVRYKYFFLSAAFIAFIITVFLVAPKLPKEFVGMTEQEDFTIYVELPTGAKLSISDEAVKKIEELVSTMPEVKSVSSRIEPWSSKVFVKLVPLAQRTQTTKEVINSLRPKVQEIEKLYTEAFIYFEEPQEVETNEIILEIYGYDYEILNKLAVEMLTRMQKVEGLTDLKIRWRKGRPEWQLVVDKDKAAAFGLTVKDVADTVHAEMRGLRATLYHTESKEVEVVARLRKDDRKTLDMVRKLSMVLRDGRQITLEQVVNFVPETGPSKIWRKNKNRMIQVSANRGSLAFGTAAEKVNEQLKDMKFPMDYYWKFGENYWRMVRNQKELSFALFLTIILIYLVLASLFESYSQPFIIMATVPLAAIGVIITLDVMKKSVNIGVLMGAMMLGGIVVNNAIILIDEINRLGTKAIKGFKAVLISGESRLRPIMMTTLTTILGLLPMAVDKSPEANLWSPLAITVMAGLTCSTMLTLGLIPSMYLVFNDVKKMLANRSRRQP
jgi:HAE1 family hydrophobic/amphiphilic exporter-1